MPRMNKKLSRKAFIYSVSALVGAFVLSKITSKADTIKSLASKRQPLTGGSAYGTTAYGN